MKLKSIKAYRLHGHQHLPFLTEKKACRTYVDYWNSKLE